jgi:hypothetical protein
MASRSCSSLGPLTNRVCAILTTSPTKKLNRWSGVPSVRPAHPRAKRQRTMGRGQSLGIRRLAVPRAGGISHPELEEQRIGIQPTKIDLDYQPRSSLRFFVRPHVLHASERSLECPSEQNWRDTRNDHFRSALRTCRRSFFGQQLASHVTSFPPRLFEEQGSCSRSAALWHRVPVPAVLQLVREEVSGAQFRSIARNLRAVSEGQNCPVRPAPRL